MHDGYQITFFTHQNRRHKGAPLGNWLMDLSRELGLRGVTLIAGGTGYGRGGRVHSSLFFELADQPVEIVMALTVEETDRLFERLKEEKVHLFYVKTAVQFGTLGGEDDQ